MLKKIARNFFLIITVAVALLTVIAGWVSIFNPSHFWFLAVLGLALPLIFLVNGVFLILWAFKRDRKALIPAVALLLILIRLPLIYQFSDKEESTANTGGSNSFEVMSFNVRLFDLYNWTHNDATRQKILSFIEFESPEVICFQEFYSSNRNGKDNVKVLKSMHGYKYAHTEYSISLYGTDHYGIATFSKHPILYKGVLNLDPGAQSTNLCIYTDIIIGPDTVRFYNFHLQSVKLGVRDYKFIEGMGQNPDEQDPVNRFKHILRRLKSAFVKRAGQAGLIASHISESPYPVVVCGDMNDTPLSYSYKMMSSELLDAFRESGDGFGFTYAGPIPGLRIDYMLHSPELNSEDFTVVYEKLSDHYPLKARFHLKK